MDHTLDAALNQLWERTSRALEDAQRNARFVERLEGRDKEVEGAGSQWLKGRGLQSSHEFSKSVLVYNQTDC
jgi:hypothetical protein